MKKIPTKIKGVFIIETDSFEDERGCFVKTFHIDFFKKNKWLTQMSGTLSL